MKSRAILRSDRYTGDELLALAKEHDPGSTEDKFVLALRAIRRLAVADFIPYEVENKEAHALIERTARWADELRNRS